MRMRCMIIAIALGQHRLTLQPVDKSHASARSRRFFPHLFAFLSCAVSLRLRSSVFGIPAFNRRSTFNFTFRCLSFV